MKLQDVLTRLQLPESSDAFAKDWDEAMGAGPEQAIGFLSAGSVAGACREVHLADNMTRAAVQAAGRIADDEALRALFWYGHYRLFVAAERARSLKWPLLTAALDQDAGMFNVLLLLSGNAVMREAHRRRHIPADVVRATALDLKLCLETEDYTLDHGRYGISARILNWLLGHWRGELYRLARLQFVPGSFHGKLRAYRHRRTGVVVALSEPGIRYRPDGQADGAGDIWDQANGWEAKLEVTGEGFEGNPIDPTGYAVREPLRLPKSEWRQVLAPGEPVLEMHIPAGEPMDYDACGEALRQALMFFPRYFPDKPFVAFSCGSWLLDPQFEQLLPPMSNLVRFQREVYLFPSRGNNHSVLVTVFGRKGDDVTNLPRRTRMQRAFADHLKRGGHFRGGGCFLMVEDLRWGEQVYRRQEHPWRAPAAKSESS